MIKSLTSWSISSHISCWCGCTPVHASSCIWCGTISWRHSTCTKTWEETNTMYQTLFSLYISLSAVFTIVIGLVPIEINHHYVHSSFLSITLTTISISRSRRSSRCPHCSIPLRLSWWLSWGSILTISPHPISSSTHTWYRLLPISTCDNKTKRLTIEFIKQEWEILTKSHTVMKTQSIWTKPFEQILSFWLECCNYRTYLRTQTGYFWLKKENLSDSLQVDDTEGKKSDSSCSHSKQVLYKLKIINNNKWCQRIRKANYLSLKTKPYKKEAWNTFIGIWKSLITQKVGINLKKWNKWTTTTALDIYNCFWFEATPLRSLKYSIFWIEVFCNNHLVGKVTHKAVQVGREPPACPPLVRPSLGGHPFVVGHDFAPS